MLVSLSAFIVGLILASFPKTTSLRSILSTLLAKVLIPVVIVYNMVFYKSGSLSLMLFSFSSAVIIYFVYLFISKDRLQALCFSYTNMVWLGFPIALALFGPEVSSPLIALYIGGSIFGNTWAVTSVSSEPQPFGEMLKKVIKSPPVMALFIALIFRLLNVQHLQHHQMIDLIYNCAKWGMSFAGMCVLGMWLRKTRVYFDDLVDSIKVALLKLLCGVVICGITYKFIPIPHITEYIGVMFLFFCLPPAANIVALETHYHGTGVSAKYIAAGTITSCVVCILYGIFLHFL